MPLGRVVDGLFFFGPAEARLQLVTLCVQARYEHSADAKVFQLKDAQWKQIPFCEQCAPSGKQCFKPQLRLSWNAMAESDFETNALDDAAQGRKLEWNQLLPASSTVPLSDATFGIIERILDNEGGLVVGSAGTGKTTILNALKVVLNATGHKFKVCSYTHAACRLVGGETVAHLLHLNAALDDPWFLAEEVGLLPVSTFGAMSHWIALGAKFVIFGDFEAQFQPLSRQVDHAIHNY